MVGYTVFLIRSGSAFIGDRPMPHRQRLSVPESEHPWIGNLSVCV
jgi:hypothetical protein